MSSDLSDLIERVAAATGGSRELDWQVACAVGHEAFAVDSTVWPPFGIGSKMDRSVPAYTASVDAALALVSRVLPGWRWSVSVEADGRFGASLIDAGGSLFEMAPTPALAIVLAMLRALEATRSDEKEKGS